MKKEQKEKFLQSIPKFLKHVYIDYLEEKNYKEKFNNLCFFNEALTAYFFCISNCKLNDNTLNNKIIDSIKDIDSGFT